MWFCWVLEVGQLTEGSKGVDQVPLKVPWAIESDGRAVRLRLRSEDVTVLRSK